MTKQVFNAITKDGRVVEEEFDTSGPFIYLPDHIQSIIHPKRKYSREGKRLLILHNESCDQFGDITGESPSHLWFTRHGGYFKLSKESGEVETLKPAEF